MLVSFAWTLTLQHQTDWWQQHLIAIATLTVIATLLAITTLIAIATLIFIVVAAVFAALIRQGPRAGVELHIGEVHGHPAVADGHDVAGESSSRWRWPCVFTG